MTTPAPPKQLLQGLQFLRANAVLLVVVTHSVAILALPRYFNTATGVEFTAKGAVGVDLFFVLSGYIIVHVALKSESLQPRLNIKNFLLRRFERIIPFLWFATTLYALIRYLGAGEFQLVAYIRTMVLWPVGELVPNVVWSLRHEALFYIIFALAFLLKRRAPALLVAWCVAPMLLYALKNTTGFEFTYPLLEFVFNRANAFFGVGVLVGLVFKRFARLRAASVRRPIFGWLLLVATSILAFMARDWWGSAAVASACAVALIVGLMTPNSRSLIARSWELVGDASYAIYLTHTLVILTGGSLWVKAVGTQHFAVAAVVNGACAVFFGIVVHKTCERPIIRLAKRLTGGPSASAPAPDGQKRMGRHRRAIGMRSN